MFNLEKQWECAKPVWNNANMHTWSICLSMCLSTCPSCCLFVRLSICLALYLTMYLGVYLSICLSTYLSMYPCIHASISPSPSLHQSMYLYVDQSIYLCVCLSICLSIYLSTNLPICPSIYQYVWISNYIFVSERKRVGEISCTSRRDVLKNGSRDLQKMKNEAFLYPARLSSKRVPSGQPHANAFCAS